MRRSCGSRTRAFATCCCRDGFATSQLQSSTRLDAVSRTAQSHPDLQRPPASPKLSSTLSCPLHSSDVFRKAKVRLVSSLDEVKDGDPVADWADDRVAVRSEEDISLAVDSPAQVREPEAARCRHSERARFLIEVCRRLGQVRQLHARRLTFCKPGPSSKLGRRTSRALAAPFTTRPT